MSSKVKLRASHGTIEVSVEQITPTIAATYLASNTDANRRIRKAVVNRYCERLSRGWKMTGDTIKFDATGRMIDGQHRLNAIIKSGITMETVVIRGLEPAVFVAIDTGSGRTIGNVLYIAGIAEHHEGMLASAINTVYYQGLGLARFKGMDSDQAFEWIEQNPDLVDWVKKVIDLPTFSVYRAWAAQLAAVLYLASRANPKMAEAFYEQFGLEMPAHKTVQLCRDAVISKRYNRHPEPKLNFLIRAWNAYLADEKPAFFKVDPKNLKHISIDARPGAEPVERIAA